MINDHTIYQHDSYMVEGNTDIQKKMENKQYIIDNKL